MPGLLNKVGIGFDSTKTKANLKMSMQRLQLQINKKNVLVEGLKRDVALLLSDGKEEKACIRVEQIIREDQTREAYEIIDMQCDLLVQRIRYLESQSSLPPDLLQTVSTIIWCADRTDVSELSTVKEQLGKKYGREALNHALKNDHQCVHPKVVSGLSIEPPTGYKVQGYLKEIAARFDIDWEPKDPIIECRNALTIQNGGYNETLHTEDYTTRCRTCNEVEDASLPMGTKAPMPTAVTVSQDYGVFNADDDSDYPTSPPPPYVKRNSLDIQPTVYVHPDDIKPAQMKSSDAKSARNQPCDEMLNNDHQPFHVSAPNSGENLNFPAMTAPYQHFDIPEAPGTSTLYSERGEVDGNHEGKNQEVDELSELEARFANLRK